jgi:hypothetical protein
MHSAYRVPQNYHGASRPDATHSRNFVFPEQATSAINEVYRFNSDLDNFKDASPLNRTGYNSSNVADGYDLSFAGVAGDNPLQDFLQLQSMQHHSSHYTELSTPNCHTATANYQYGDILDVGSTWPY